MPPSPGPSPSPALDHAPTDPLAAVRGRVLLHVKSPEHAPLVQVSPSTGGVVFSGRRAASHVRDFVRARERPCPVVLDPSAYESHVATPEAPFLLRESSLFEEDQLRETLHQLTMSGADLVLTPTGFLTADENGAEALRQAAGRVDALDAADVVLAVPLDALWLSRREQLVSLLQRIRAPKALILGARGNPVESASRAQALRETVFEAGETALLRTDLAGLDAMVHGAPFTSIGDTSSTRHTVPPWEDPRVFTRNRSPNVLDPNLMAYVRGMRLAEQPVGELLRCTCVPCVEAGEARGSGAVGRLLNTLHDHSDTAQAHAHNMAVWSRWWSDLSRETTRGRAEARWRALCAGALHRYGEYNGRFLRANGPFTPSGALRYWAGEGG